MLAVFTIAFRRLPVHLMLAENEEEAQHCVEHTPPDLFLVDLQLHGKNGVEVAERILQRTGQRVPIIVVTAETGDPIDSYVRSGRCLGYVRKPIALGTFGADILRYLSISTNEIGPQSMHSGSLSPASLEVTFLTSVAGQSSRFPPTRRFGSFGRQLVDSSGLPVGIDPASRLVALRLPQTWPRL